MNGGNPSSVIDPAQLKDYPLGTAPDANYRGYSFDFQLHASPNGAIEYKSNTFNGALKGKLLVVRYSQHKDIITLTPGGRNNDIVSALEGYAIEGFSGFVDPLDITEDTTNGNIYVSEYGGNGRIVLLKPKTIIKLPVTDTLSPLADATVKDGEFAGKNFGIDTSLTTKNALTAGNNRVTYLKFSLSSVKKAYHAVLKLYGRNTTNFSPINIFAFGVNNDSWTEKGITWKNAPPVQNISAGSAIVDNELKYWQTDVTDYVKTQLAGDTVISLAIKDTADENTELSFNSKENNKNHPQLIITTDTISYFVTHHHVRTVMPVRLSTIRPSCDDSNVITRPDLPLVLADDAQKSKVYPNPLYKEFNIQLGGRYNGSVILQIIDPLGKTIDLGERVLRPGETNIRVNISNLSLNAGAYFLKISSNAKTELIKLIVQ